MIVSCEASFKFHRTMLPKHNRSHAQDNAQSNSTSSKYLHFATVSCNRPTESYERVHPAKSKCASRYNGVPSKISKCTFRYSGVHKNLWIQRTTSVATRGIQKSPFYHSFRRPTSTKWREGCAVELKIRVSSQFWTSDEHEATKGLRERAANLHFTWVLDVRQAQNDERVASAKWKFAFHHSFGRPTSTKWREGCVGNLKSLHVTTVLDVRRARSDERVARRRANSHFTTVLGVRRARSDERVVSRRCQPNPPDVKRRKKKKEIFQEVLIHSHSQQLFSAAIRSSHSQQPLLSSSSQQPFSPAILRVWWSAILITSLWSGVGGQLLSHHVAVVRGWWSAIVTSCCCGQGLVVSYCHIMLLWSGVGGQLLSHHVAVVRGWWSAIVTFFRRTLSRSFREEKHVLVI